MIPLFTPAQVRDMDERAFARGVAPLALMERAAGHLARAVVRAGGHGYGLRVGILCGKGNNGGDGLAAARRLLDAGALSTVCLVAGDDSLSGDAAVQLDRWREAGGRIATSVAATVDAADVVVDCLLGTGATGEPRDPFGAAIEALNARRDPAVPVVACDLPSGVDADTGQVPGAAVHADVTLTLGAHKRGLWLWPARGYCGRLDVGDLGIVDDSDGPVADVLGAPEVAAAIPPPRPDADKRTRGVVVVLAGSPGMTGAATLVARGAMAAGAGLVTVATSEQAVASIAPTVPEALTQPLPDDDPDAAFERLAGALEGADALAVGPGLGHAAPTAALVKRLVREIDLPIVLDADGLNVYRGEGDRLADHVSALLVCTPHAREFARMLGQPPEVWGQRCTVAPDRAEAWNAVLVAKGPGSLVAAPDGRVWVNATGGGALATGGTGDVLTGMTATLVAQQPEPESVAAAVWLHGLAGEFAGTRRRARSVVASDVAGAVPAALNALEPA